MMMDNVQNCDSYINIPLPQTYRSYYHDGEYVYIQHYLPVSDIVQSGSFTTFRRNLLPSIYHHPVHFCLLLAWFTLRH
jgi:hypothetical protein